MPGSVATVVATLALASTPITAFYAGMNLAMNSRPTSGSAYVVFGTSSLSELDSSSSLTTTSQIEVESWARSVVDGYYLPTTVHYTVPLVGIVLAALVAVCVLLRRPLSRAIQAALVMVAAGALAAAVVVPGQHDAALRAAAAEHDLPTLPDEARAAGTDLYVSVENQWLNWTAAWCCVAVLAVLTALYLAHVRRATTPR